MENKETSYEEKKQEEIDSLPDSEIRKNKIISIMFLLMSLILLAGLMAYMYLPYLYTEHIRERTMDITVMEDGKVKVEDEWDIKIINSNTLYINFDQAQAENFSNVKVSRFNKRTNLWEPLKLNADKSKYQYEKLNYYHNDYFQGKFEIGWGVGLKGRFANRKYKVEYIVDGPTQKYLDTAEYYHMLVGKKFDLPIRKFIAKIKFPKPLDKSNSQIWGHGIYNGKIHFDNGNIRVEAQDIMSEFVEARVIFSKEDLPLRQEIKVEKRKDILFEESINTGKTLSSNPNFEYTDRNQSINQPRVIQIVLVIVFLVLVRIIVRSVKHALNTKHGTAIGIFIFFMLITLYHFLPILLGYFRQY